ncbi:hypothetical protein SERLA73DRAFT_76286 [Serpula lacrymans var. lacrymans S7.3]|uniref:Prolyl 4-hydroxylase alpha subunit Fe(2+) 2OG dioxygenase domain-containing protein n=2 Tax=Serpula lacrymans var. lacrymans TaxID=341189 RepID=F8Q6S1_SERL3|nr:uncharacterized protein SERLADRAFT_441078 [Serpula lacrymans var. lacrymans S7.9]EGN96309.1 hypothetical protein SERLA73DRAFT_76286 [Serpula lacrymans var. lacrymans S7.3]EGO21845.1 hypothetical protein SERLADRAFT_441078 [Serpula lacrymans var. lacrymans S7.9]
MSDRNSLVQGQSQPTTVAVADINSRVKREAAEAQLLLLQPTSDDDCGKVLPTAQTHSEKLPNTCIKVETSNAVLTYSIKSPIASSATALSGDSCPVGLEYSTPRSENVTKLPAHSESLGEGASSRPSENGSMEVRDGHSIGSTGPDKTIVSRSLPQRPPDMHSQVGGKSIVVYGPPLEESRNETGISNANGSLNGQSILCTEDVIMKVDVDVENGDDGNHDGDHDSDMLSDISGGENVQDDLEEAFGGDFKFKGQYAFSSPLPHAPNPGLCVDGLGLIGLPLSERDAQSIKRASAQAPFGHGERTIVDKQVRDTWEIEPGRVKFLNPAWQQYVDSIVVGQVWTTLGVAPYTAIPRCELYKMLLYETGSHFLPHRDTEKANGMFATIIIVLPSLYSGGQVHVSHGASKQIFDLASSSAFTTSLLAWYTDVMHEVKPVASGYRLALSYNLIHTSTGLAPSIPDMESATWKIRRIFPQFKYNVTGVADDCGYGNHGWMKRRRCAYDYYGDSESDGGTPSMLEETESSLSLSNVVDLYGQRYLRSGDLSIEMEDLIPCDPFEDVEPDDKEYEGYMGNYGGTVEHWYRRTVLLLFRREDEESIILKARGYPYALQKLAGVHEPAASHRKLVDYLMDRITPHNNGLARFTVDIATRWGDIALWKSILAKCGGDKKAGVIDNEKLVAGLKKFGFENVKVIMTQIAAECSTLKNRTEFIESLRPGPSDPERQVVDIWCNEQMLHALHSLKLPAVSDVPILMAAVLQRGIKLFAEVILPQLAKFTSTFGFWMLLIRSLHSKANVLCIGAPEPPPVAHGQISSQADTPKTNRDIFMKAFSQCIDIVMLQWDAVVAQPPYPYYSLDRSDIYSSNRGKVARIVNLIDLCISIGHAGACVRLLVLVINEPKDSIDAKCKTILEPLVPAVRNLLRTSGIDICSPTFNEFFRLIVATYLFHVLGAQPKISKAPKLRRIGCGCQDCNLLDSFVMSSTQSQTFWLGQARRTHLGRYLNSARDLVIYETVRTGSPHGLEVTKSKDVVAMTRWHERQTSTKTFLASIGNNATIQKLMGSRYVDIGRALNGTQSFELGNIFATSGASSSISVAMSNLTAPFAAHTPNRDPLSFVSAPAVASGVAQPLSSHASTGTAPTASSSSPAVTGKRRRRKATISTTDVIDLT